MNSQQTQSGTIRVEVVYALRDRQELVSLELPQGASAQSAVERSGMLLKHPEIDPVQMTLGIFSKLVRPDQELKDRDRVEIYRPLLADPKEVRRQRAAEGKAMKKGAGAKPGQ